MRTVLIAATLLASAGTAQAGQRMVMQGPGVAPPAMGGGAMAPRPGPMPGGTMNGGPGMGPRPVGMQHGPGGFPGNGGQGGGRHWGGQYQGHWVGGMRAPGGWGGYRQPYRGYGLPGYWISPSFLIGDWGTYGLYQPPVGYNWSRYYDDAVLIDNRGSVYDTIGGIDWNRYDLDEAQGGQADAYDANTNSYHATAGAGYPYPPQGGYAGQPGGGYVPQGGYPQQGGYYPQQRRSNGVGGALIGGAAGGIAGGLIAGRHDKVAGALIGAGAGALAGYAIDRNAHRRHDYPQAGGPGADYPAPGGPGYGPGPGYPPPGSGYAQPTIVQSGGGTLVTTSTVGGGYYSGGTVTTVTVATAPVVTTTTEVFEDSVTYTRRPVHKVYRKHVWHKPVCYCR